MLPGLGVVADDGALAERGDQLGGVGDGADDGLLSRPRRTSRADTCATLALVDDWRLQRDRDLGGLPALGADFSGTTLAGAHANRRRPRSASPRARRPGCRGRASSRRASGACSSNWRKTSRSLEQSGSRAASSAGSTSTGTSRMIVAICLEIRASSAWLVRFSLRLAPEIWSTEGEHRLEVVELLQQRRGGLVADAGNARDVVRRCRP